MQRIFSPVYYHEGALSLAVEKYTEEIDARITVLRKRMPREEPILEVIRSSNAYVDVLTRGLTRVADTPPPEEIAWISSSISQTERAIEKVDAMLQRVAAEREQWLVLTPFASRKLFDLLICPLSRQLLTDAIRLPSGATVNAFAIGYRFREGRIECQDPSVLPTLQENPLIGASFFTDSQNLFDEDAYRAALRRDFKTVELAVYFQKGKTLPYDILFDKVLGGLYEDPQLMPCGHTESASRGNASCNTSCQQNYRRYEAAPHTLLLAFIEAYKTACRPELLAERMVHLQNLVNLKLRKASAVKPEYTQLKKEREALLKQRQIALEALAKLDPHLEELEREKKHFKEQRQILQSQIAVHSEQSRRWRQKQGLISDLNSVRDKIHYWDERLRQVKQMQNEAETLAAERGRYDTLLFSQVYQRVASQPALVYQRCALIARIRLLNSY